MQAPTPPTVSIVIPVYNGARHLADTLQSALEQTYPASEIILIDDGSSDDSHAVIQRVAETSPVPISYEKQVNQGPGAARNRGVELARGHWIAFLDQDDLWLPSKLERQVALLLQSPEAAYSITKFEFFLEAGVGPTWVRPAWFDTPQSGFFPSCLVISHENFTRIGPFDAGLKIGSDTDWFMRVRQSAVPYCMVPEILMRHRVHASNQSRLLQASHHELCHILHRVVHRQRQAGNVDE